MTSGLLALALCTLLALWLSGARSLAWLAYYASFVPFVTLDLADGAQTAEALGSGVAQTKMFVRLAATGLALLLTLPRRSAWSAFGERRLLPVVFLLLWACLGLVGVEDALVPLLRLGELAGFVLLGVLLWSTSADENATLRTRLRWHAVALLPLLGITLVYTVMRPELAMHVADTGLVRMGNRLINAETLGTTAALLALWATAELKEPREHEAGFARERVLPFVCLVLAFGVLLFARSRTAMIATVAGEALLWSPLFGATRRQWATSLVLLVGGLVAAVASVDAIGSWFLRGDSVANLKNGTGRTELWAHLLADSAPQHPLLGQGWLRLGEHGAFEHAGHPWTNAHNTYLGALLYMGVPGLVAVLAIFGIALRAAWRRARRPGPERGAWTLLLALFALAAINSATSFGIVGWPNPLMLFFYGLFPLAVLGPRNEPEREFVEADELDLEPSASAPSGA